MRTITAALWAAAAAGPVFGQATLLPQWTLKGRAAAEGAWTIAEQAIVIDGRLPDGAAVELPLRMGAVKRAVVCRIEGTDGRSLELTLSAADASVPGKGKDARPIALPDSHIDVSLRAGAKDVLFRDRYFIRPNPTAYRGDDRPAHIANWERLPPASQHELRLRIEPVGDSAAVWLDDHFLGRAEIGLPTALRLSLSAGNAVGPVKAGPVADHGRFIPIGLAGYRRPGDAPLTESSLARRGEHVLDGIPFAVGAAGDEIDVGRSRWTDEKIGPDEFADKYYSRHAFDSRPEDVLLAVPTDDYAFAHLLCAVAPDPAKTPAITLRLTRFINDGGDSGGRGDGLADTTLRLEKTGGRWPEGCRQVGTVRAGGAELPLLQVAVPLRSGQIPDVIDETGIVWGRSSRYLDLELTKELHIVRTLNYGAHSIKPLGKPSGVRVQALTLERAPVKIRLRPRAVGHVFHPTEKAGYDLECLNRTPAAFAGTLHWRISDFYGHSQEGRQTVAVPADGAPHRIAVDPGAPEIGWHGVELNLIDERGRTVWEHSTSLAVLAPDTRKAGAESPYGTWWFRESHFGTRSADEVAPLLKRMGFRHVSPGSAEADDLARNGLTISMIPYIGGKWQDAVKKVDAYIAKHPTVKWAMIYHENGINYARYIREKHPDIKLIVGNGGSPFPIELMRQGWPKEYVDAWGDETLGQAINPESPPTWNGSAFWIAEYSKLYGYDAKMTSCYEWRGRGTNPGNLTPVEQAQFYVRDVLEGLAHRMPHINPGLLHDVGDAYFYSRWGSGGFCRRWPLMSPKPSYVAMAVLTQELDRAEFRRFVDSPSPTLPVMEFVRGDEFVYVLWLPRGRREVTIGLKEDGPLRWVDMNGRATAPAATDKQVRLTVSDSPAYLTTRSPIVSLKPADTDCGPAPAGLTIVNTLGDAAEWEAVRAADQELETVHFDFPRRAGDIAVEGVTDEAMGPVLQLTLRPQPDIAWPVARYVTLKPRKPVLLPAGAGAVGLWVKGNSSWGRVLFELEDAKGERFFSIGAPCDGFSVGDWKAKTFINFDGWNHIRVPLPFKYAGGFYGPPECEWTSKGGDGVVDGPARVTRVVVELRDKVVQLTRPVDVPQRSVRIARLSVSKP